MGIGLDYKIGYEKMDMDNTNGSGYGLDKWLMDIKIGLENWFG